MKTLKILLLIIPVTIFLSSCGGDDPMDDPASMSGLQDEWTAISLDINVTSTLTLPVGSTETVTEIIGTDFDYDLTFGESDWTTNGGYTYSAKVSLDDMELSTSNVPVTGVSGSGNYTTEDDQMIIDGSFFEIEENGMTNSSVFEGEQKATFEINEDDQLVFTQDETVEQTQQGFTSISRITSTSIWERK